MGYYQESFEEIIPRERVVESDESDQECVTETSISQAAPLLGSTNAETLTVPQTTFSDPTAVWQMTTMVSDDSHNVWDFIDQHIAGWSQSECDNDSDDCIEDRLAAWVTEYEVKQIAANCLLKLHTKSGHPSLPSTTRTLLHTYSEVEIQPKSVMNYYDFGLEEQ